MSGYIEQVLLHNVEYEIDEIDKINKTNKINEIVDFISKNITKKNNFKTVIDDFLDEYLSFDSKIFISRENFLNGINNNIIDLDAIKKFIQIKPTKEEIRCIVLSILNLEKLIDNNPRRRKYTDKTICDFIKYFIVDLNLSHDIKKDETPVDYLKRIYSIYYKSPNVFKNNLLKNNKCTRYYIDVLKLHSLILSNCIDFNSEIIKMFTEFLCDLYFDRDDGYKMSPLELSKPFETINLDINTLFQNTVFQVNLFSFVEDQREPDSEKRTNLFLIEKLLKVGKIFNLIGHDVIIVGSKFKTNDYNQGVWVNTPYEFDEMYDEIMLNYPKLPFNSINIYIKVNFEAM